MSSSNVTNNNSSNVPQPNEGQNRRNKNCKALPKLVVNIKRVLSEENLQVHVKRFGKVQQIKKKVKKLTGIPIVDQTLIFSGRQLDNTERIVLLLPPVATHENAELTLFLLVNKNSKHASIKNDTKKDIDVASPSAERQIEAEELKTEDSIPQQEQQQNFSDSSLLSLREDVIEEVQESNAATAPVFQDLLASSVIVKISFEGQHRRVPFEGASFSRLTSLCTGFFGVKNVNRMVLRYQDEDGDLVQISSDVELAYALATHSSASSSGGPVLKLVFSLKPVQPKAGINNSNNEDNNKTIFNSSETRRLRDGDVIQLSNGDFSLVLTPTPSLQGTTKLVIEGKKGDQSESSQWIVKKAVAKSNQKKQNGARSKDLSPQNKGEEKEVIFLKNKTLSNGNKQLRVVATGEAQHSGGFGKWSRFVVDYLPNDGGIQLRSVGRSLLRDVDSSASSFLGLSQEQGPDGAVRVVASGTFKKIDEASKFALRFVQ